MVIILIYGDGTIRRQMAQKPRMCGCHFTIAGGFMQMSSRSHSKVPWLSLSVIWWCHWWRVVWCGNQSSKAYSSEENAWCLTLRSNLTKYMYSYTIKKLGTWTASHWAVFNEIRSVLQMYRAIQTMDTCTIRTASSVWGSGSFNKIH